MSKTKKTTTRVKKKSLSKDEPINAKIVLDATDDNPQLYVNYAEISNSKHEFQIAFARLPTKPSQSQLLAIRESKTLLLSPEIRLIVPPTLMPNLVKAMIEQIEKYEQDHGKIVSEKLL